MVSFNRVMSFDEYFEANRIAIKRGTARQRFNYWTCLYVMPVLCTLALPLFVWFAVQTWREPGDHAWDFGMNLGLVVYCLIMACYRLMFRRKVRRLFAQQKLDRNWLMEISDAGIHSALEGLSDSKMEWAFFQRYVETDQLFVLLVEGRTVFISIPKASLSEEQSVELRRLLDARLKRV